MLSDSYQARAKAQMIPDSYMIQTIYRYLVSVVDEENIQIGYLIKGKTFSYRADIFLKQGCPLLGYYGPTIIELKYRLAADTLYLCSELFKNNLKEYGIVNFILLYDRQNQYSNSLLKEYEKLRDECFFVYSIGLFCNKKLSDRSNRRVSIPFPDYQKQTLIDAHNAFIDGHNTLFLGAGLGKSIALPDWEELLKEILRDKKGVYSSTLSEGDYSSIEQSLHHSPIILGRYIEKIYGSEERMKQKMHQVLYRKNPNPDSPLYKALVEIIREKGENGDYYIDQAITFNYDDLLETAMEITPQSSFDQYRPSQSIFEHTIYTGKAFPVYHVHGMIPQKRMIDSTPVLGELEYHRLYKESYHWSNVIQLYALLRTTCFFVGLSMTDPNLRRLLDISRSKKKNDKSYLDYDLPKHYAIMERVPLDKSLPDSKKDEVHHRNQERMMAELGIRIIWYDYEQYEKIPEILDIIKTGNIPFGEWG